MSQDIEGYLEIFLACLAFISAIIYFIVLYRFMIYMQNNYPNEWSGARKKGRFFESNFATGYRIFANFESLQKNQVSVDDKSVALAKIVKIAQLFALGCFMIILIGGLYLSVNK